MTLILSLQNSNFTIQVSDRRLSLVTLAGSFLRPIHEEWNKAGVLVTSDSRLAYGYAGFARFGFFDFRTWLRKTLVDCASPDFKAIPTVERLTKALSDEFRSHPVLRFCPKGLKSSQVCFSGFLYSDGWTRAVFAIVTNTTSSVKLKENYGSDGFRNLIWYEALRIPEIFASVQRIGNWRALGTENEKVLETMLRTGLPAVAIRGKAFEVMKAVSESSVAGKTIGAQLSAITIPRDFTLPIDLAYRSNVNANRLYVPDIVFAFNKNQINWLTLDLRNEDSIPAIVPKVARNWPCPCRSGKKFKHCHGKNRNYH